MSIEMERTASKRTWLNKTCSFYNFLIQTSKIWIGLRFNTVQIYIISSMRARLHTRPKPKFKNQSPNFWKKIGEWNVTQGKLNVQNVVLMYIIFECNVILKALQWKLQAFNFTLNIFLATLFLDFHQPWWLFEGNYVQFWCKNFFL